MKKKTRGKKILIGAAAILAAAGIFLFGFFFVQNPWFDAWMRAQFGDDLFDFSEFTVEEDEAQTLEEVIAKYEPVFMSLQDTALERLEELYQSAAAEYRSEKTAGTLDRFQLTNKYLQAGRLLEKTVDEAFYSLLEGMEKELKSKNLPTFIVTDIEAEYIEAKEEKKESLFKRARETVGF